MKKRNAYGFSKDLPVAGRANPRHKGLTKAEKRLAARRADHEKTLASNKEDLSRCYHKPGSLQ